MSDSDNQNLSNDEKKKKQEEITRRLAEIKNKLKSQPQKKTANAEEKPTDKTRNKLTNPTTKKSTTTKPDKTAPPAGEKPVSTNWPVDKTNQQPELPITKTQKTRTTPTVKKSEVAKSVSKVDLPDKKVSEEKTNQKKKWSENQLKVRESNPAKPATNKQIEIKPIMKKERNKKRTLILIISLIAVIIAGGAWWYLFIYEQQNELVEMEQLENITTSSADANNEEPDAIAAEETENMESEDPDSEINASNSEVSTPASTVKSEFENDKWGLKKPCYIISYIATKSEQSATKQSKLLTSKGFSAGYYWIPDYLPSGPSLFKVYIGPFDSKENASRSLAPVQRLKKDAYIQHVK